MEWRAIYTDLPWREMVGTRNIVIHHYFGVDERAHWQIENRRHWCLDVAFDEDDSRVRRGY